MAVRKAWKASAVASAVTGLALIGFIGLAAPASATIYHGEVTVAGGTDWLQVTEGGHGPPIHFAVGYAWDNYIHQDILPASANIREIDNYTGQNPDTGAKFNGCAATRHPDRLTTWDDDANGLVGQPWTSLHHNANLTFRPSGSGPYFSWCHYEHGPETWVKITFKDGSTIEIYWAVPTSFYEVLLKTGSTVTVTPVGAADE